MAFLAGKWASLIVVNSHNFIPSNQNNIPEELHNSTCDHRVPPLALYVNCYYYCFIVNFLSRFFKSAFTSLFISFYSLTSIVPCFIMYSIVSRVWRVRCVYDERVCDNVLICARISMHIFTSSIFLMHLFLYVHPYFIPIAMTGHVFMSYIGRRTPHKVPYHFFSSS